MLCFGNSEKFPFECLSIPYNAVLVKIDDLLRMVAFDEVHGHPFKIIGIFIFHQIFDTLLRSPHITDPVNFVAIPGGGSFRSMGRFSLVPIFIRICLPFWYFALSIEREIKLQNYNFRNFMKTNVQPLMMRFHLPLAVLPSYHPSLVVLFSVSNFPFHLHFAFPFSIALSLLDPFHIWQSDPSLGHK